MLTIVSYQHLHLDDHETPDWITRNISGGTDNFIDKEWNHPSLGMVSHYIHDILLKNLNVHDI